LRQRLAVAADGLPRDHPLEARNTDDCRLHQSQLSPIRKVDVFEYLIADAVDIRPAATMFSGLGKLGCGVCFAEIKLYAPSEDFRHRAEFLIYYA
jgi:hypothetical protein